MAGTFRDAVDVFGAALDAAMHLLREVDPLLAERAEAYGVDTVLDISIQGHALTGWLDGMSIALDGRDLQGQQGISRTDQWTGVRIG